MEQKLTALIVDDEERARKLLNKLLEETLCFNEIRLAHSINSAITELDQFNPDLIFLDIKMPGKDGFSLINDLRKGRIRPGIIFVTAHEEYAIQAVKSHAFDYLLKPVNRKELKQCIQNFIDSKSDDFHPDIKPKPVEMQEKISRIKVNTRSGTLFINPADILYCKADGNYTTICTGEKKHLCSLNLGKIGEQLPQNGFMRVGRSYIVNFEYVTILDRKDSKVTLQRHGEAVSITIPRHHLKDFDQF
jgi:two-component system LytT family response regulator